MVDPVGRGEAGGPGCTGVRQWGRGGVRSATIRTSAGGNKTAIITVPVMGDGPAETERQWAEAARRGADLIEWRLDAVGGAADLTLGEELRCRFEIPVLATVRTVAEGGGFPLGPATQGLYRDLTLGSARWAEAVDVELSAPDAEQLTRQAQAHGADVVMSHHRFEPGVDLRVLKRRLSEMVELGADVAKVAWLAAGPADVRAVQEAQQWAAQNLPIPAVVIAMGEEGAPTRLGAAARHNAFTFAVAAKSSAPGQLSIETVRASLVRP